LSFHVKNFDHIICGSRCEQESIRMEVQAVDD
jgi:hypothetical protein